MYLGIKVFNSSTSIGIKKLIAPVLFLDQMWRYPFAQVLFDSDPLGADKPDAAVTKEMSQAMIR